MIYQVYDLAAMGSSDADALAVRQLGTIDHFALTWMSMRGEIMSHKHPLHDELLLLISGQVTLSTAGQELALAQQDVVYIPQGLGHQVIAPEGGSMLVMAVQGNPERRNGHGGANPSQRVVVRRPREELVRATGYPFFSITVAQADDMVMRAGWWQGVVNWHRHGEHDELLLVLDGQVEVGTEAGPIQLMPNMATIVPRKRVHNLIARRQSLLLALINNAVPASAQMGREG
ncbi:MAG: cupin domain-containing protein [Chloroflexi bacterium]|nr:cupin domain-containing protein [Chloroflexota bacterium]